MGILGLGRQPGQPRYDGAIHNLYITESVLGSTIPILIGTRRLHGKLLDYYGFNAQKQSAPTGKGGIFGSKGDYYEYYATVVIALAQGPCIALLNVWDYSGMLENLSSIYAYTVPPGGGTVTPVAGNSAPIQINLGASKAVAYSVATNDYGGAPKTLTGTQNVPMQKVGSSPGLGQYSFNATTGAYTFGAAEAGSSVSIVYSSTFSLYYFVQTQAGLVPSSSPWQITPDNFAYFYQDLGVTFIDNNTAGVSVGGTPSATNEYNLSSGIYTFFSGDAGRPVYIKYSYTSQDATVTSSSVLNLLFFNGAQSQAPWSYTESANPSHALGYTGICYVASQNLDLGQTAQTPPYNYEVMGQAISPISTFDALIADAMALVLSDPLCGIGLSTGSLDTAGTWVTAVNHWLANNFFISDVLEASGGIADLLKKWCDAGNTAAFFSGGLLKLVPYSEVSAVGNGATYVPPTQPVGTLTWDDILLPGGQKPGAALSDDFIAVDKKAPIDKYNIVQCNWSERENSYNNDLLQQQNDAAIALYTQRMESAQDWGFITVRSAAQWALSCRLNRGIYVDKTLKFTLTYVWDFLEPMDVLVLPTGISVRVTKIDEDENQMLAIEAENFVYGASNATLYPTQPPSRYQPTQGSTPPGSTYPAFVQNTSQQTGGVLYRLTVAAAGDNPNWGGCQVWVSVDGTNYSQVGVINEPCAIGVLSTALPATADPDTTDTLSVDMSISGVELVGATKSAADQFATLCALITPDGLTCEFISYENCTLTAPNRYNITYLRRGVSGTTVAAFPPGSSFVYIGSAHLFQYQYTAAQIGQPLFVKLPAFNLTGQAIQPLTQCKAYELFLTAQGSTPTGTKYSPSAFADTGTVGTTNPTAAYDGNVLSAATGNATISGTGGQTDICTWSGFPSFVTDGSQKLYISYRITATSSGSGTGFAEIVGIDFVSPGTSQGTAVQSIPSGTNINTISVTAEASASAVGGSASGQFQVYEIWII